MTYLFSEPFIIIKEKKMVNEESKKLGMLQKNKSESKAKEAEH